MTQYIADWQQPPRRHRGLFFLVLAILAVVIFSSRTALSYYVDALWFGSLGYGEVFRKTLALQWIVFRYFLLSDYGWFLALRRAYRSDLPDDYRIVIGGQPVTLPVALILHLLGLGISNRHRRGVWCQHHDGVADLSTLLVRTTHDRRRCGSDLRQGD